MITWNRGVPRAARPDVHMFLPHPTSSLHKYVVACDPLDGSTCEVCLGALVVTLLEPYADNGPVSMLRLGMTCSAWRIWVHDGMRNILIAEINHFQRLQLPLLIQLGPMPVSYQWLDPGGAPEAPSQAGTSPLALPADVVAIEDPVVEQIDTLIANLNRSIEIDYMELNDSESERLRAMPASRSRSPSFIRSLSPSPSLSYSDSTSSIGFPPGHWGPPNSRLTGSIRYSCDFAD